MISIFLDIIDQVELEEHKKMRCHSCFFKFQIQKLFQGYISILNRKTELSFLARVFAPVSCFFESEKT